MRWAIFSGPVPYNLLLTLSPQVLAGAGVYGGREVPSNHQFHAIDDPPAATMPRHKKYDWADKKDICYRLWVEEEKSLPQVQEYFSQALGVAEDCIPSYVSLPVAHRATVLSPHTASSNTCSH